MHVKRRASQPMKNKFIISLCIFVCLFSFTILPCSALEVSPSNNVVSTSSNASNLINYANSYDSFIYSDFVVFQSGDYEYYIVWCDELTVNNSVVTGTDIEYIRYYRSGNVGNSYLYRYGTDKNFKLNLNDYIVTSNINIGMTSSVYSDYRTNFNITYLLVIGVSLLFANMLTNFRRVY